MTGVGETPSNPSGTAGPQQIIQKLEALPHADLEAAVVESGLLDFATSELADCFLEPLRDRRGYILSSLVAAGVPSLKLIDEARLIERFVQHMKGSNLHRSDESRVRAGWPMFVLTEDPDLELRRRALRAALLASESDEHLRYVGATLMHYLSEEEVDVGFADDPVVGPLASAAQDRAATEP